MKKFFFILLLLSLFQCSISRYQYYQTVLKEIFDILKKKIPDEFEEENININYNQIVNDDNSVKSNNYQIEVDSNDHIHVDLWNELNKVDIKHMPQVNDYSSETEAIQWLKWYLPISRRYHQIDLELSFNYNTNMNVENQQAITNQSLIQSPFTRMTLPIARNFNEYMKYSKDENLKRIFSRLASGSVSYNSENTKKMLELYVQMKKIYATTEICEPNDKKICYTLSPYLERTMQIEKDYDRLIWAWKGWHDGCGNQIRRLYLPFINLLNNNTKENGYKDLSELWVDEYEMGNTTKFESTIDQLLEDIMPLYKQLHAYVRGRLCSIYPNRFDCNGPIPAHLLGNMWAQDWQDRLDDFIPYPNTPLVDIKNEFHEKNYSIYKMYTTAEDFFTSIGLYPMTSKFWTRSMFKKPLDRDVDCQPAANDLKYHDDYRVKICTEMNGDYFYIIHHEMGHVEYFMSYDKKQPYVYQDGANPGFHEAVGDTIGMYAISPNHSIKLGFLEEKDVNQRYEINYLMRLALQKVAFIPFSYVMDKYRFLLFRNEINPAYELNSMWWKLRIEHSGIMAAIPRNNEINFDPGAKYHISANVPYFRYFIAYILQFQFYRALCRLQGQTKQLHMCDIYGNKYVGRKFKEMLAMGNSKSWEDILENLTGENKLESQAILDFFEPLYDWLKIENSRKGYSVGWM